MRHATCLQIFVTCWASGYCPSPRCACRAGVLHCCSAQASRTRNKALSLSSVLLRFTAFSVQFWCTCCRIELRSILYTGQEQTSSQSGSNFCFHSVPAGVSGTTGQRDSVGGDPWAPPVDGGTRRWCWFCTDSFLNH